MSQMFMYSPGQIFRAGKNTLVKLYFWTQSHGNRREINSPRHSWVLCESHRLTEEINLKFAYWKRKLEAKGPRTWDMRAWENWGEKIQGRGTSLPNVEMWKVLSRVSLLFVNSQCAEGYRTLSCKSDIDRAGQIRELNVVSERIYNYKCIKMFRD